MLSVSSAREEWPHVFQNRVSRLQARVRVALLVVAGRRQLLVEVGRKARGDVLLVEQASGFPEGTERLIERLALADQPAEAVREDRRGAAAVEQGLERLLTGLLGLEACPLVGATLGAETGRSEIGFGLLEPRSRIRWCHDDTIAWPPR